MRLLVSTAAVFLRLRDLTKASSVWIVSLCMLVIHSGARRFV